MYISIEQAIDVYNDLIDAKNDAHGFGGTVAEIYVYTLMPNSPTYSMKVENNKWDEEREIANQLVDAVMEELVKFTLLTRDVAPYLVDRYSERKESAAQLMQRVNQAAI